VALGGTSRGAGNHNTSALTFTASSSGNFAASSWAILCVACDNADTAGNAHSTFTVEDSIGNTWNRVLSPHYDPGSASAGVEGGIFTTNQNVGAITTGTTITVTFDANTTAKCWTLTEMTVSGGTPEFVNGADSGGSATASPTIVTTALNSGDFLVGCLFNERGTDQTVTGDSDTDNGNWSSQQTTEIGSTTGGMTISSQFKVITGDGTQTYNPTLGTSSDVVVGWVAFRIPPATAYRDWYGCGWW
jgi:hypothetical protein